MSRVVDELQVPIKFLDLWMFIVAVQIRVMSFEIKQDMLETLQKR